MAFPASEAGAKQFETLTLNKFISAESIDQGMTQSGIQFSLGEGYKSYYPEIRYGLGALMEVGVKFGVTTVDTGPDDRNAALVGLDLKYQLVKQSEGIPLDMAVDLGFDTHLLNSKNVSEVTFATIVSKSYPLTERGYKLKPYGGIEMSSVSGSYMTHDITNYYVFAGLEWKISRRFMTMLEFKTGDGNIGGIGIRFEY